MDDGGVGRSCAAALAGIADARAELLAAAAVDWRGSAAERFGASVEDLLAELVRLTRRLEHARALAVAAAREVAAGPAGLGSAGDACGSGGAAWAG